MKKIAALLLTSASAWAQPAIAPPQMGFVQDRAGLLRPAYGLAGNFILGPAVAEHVASQSFSGSLGLLKTDSSIVAFDSHGKLLGSIHTTPGPALFAFSADGVTALAYVESTNTLVGWRDGRFVSVPVRPQTAAGSVLAIALPNAWEASLIVQRDAGIWEVRLPLIPARIHSQRALAGVAAPLLSLPSGDLLYSDSTGIVLRKPDGTEIHLAADLPSRFTLQQMDRDWAQLTDLTGSARFAIHTAPGHEGFYQLPELSQ